MGRPYPKVTTAYVAKHRLYDPDWNPIQCSTHFLCMPCNRSCLQLGIFCIGCSEKAGYTLHAPDS